MRKFKDTTLGIKKPSAWRLDGASVRRAAMTLAAVILTTITAWATGININTGTIADIPDQGYTGSAIVPDITLTVGDKVLTEGTDYTVTCTDNVNVGTATLTATGQGDYTGTLTKNFRIYYADKTGSCVPSSSYDTIELVRHRRHLHPARRGPGRSLRTAHHQRHRPHDRLRRP